MKKVIAVACGLMLAGSVMAVEGISIGGDANNTVSAGDITNAAGGGTAEQNVGAVMGNVEIGGDLNQSVSAGEIKNTAGGGTATQNVGVIKSN